MRLLVSAIGNAQLKGMSRFGCIQAAFKKNKVTGRTGDGSDVY